MLNNKFKTMLDENNNIWKVLYELLEIFKEIENNKD